MPLAINSRTCITCGKPTTCAVYCFRCYRSSPAGKNELRLENMVKRYQRVEDGGQCKQCVHWYHRCTLGIPEAGTVFAELCSAREVDSVLE
jgi:hypothetical protein